LVYEDEPMINFYRSRFPMGRMLGYVSVTSRLW